MISFSPIWILSVSDKTIKIAGPGQGSNDASNQ